MQTPQSVAGAIFSPDRRSILLIQRRDVPVWVLPGGGLEPNESPEAAIMREILEETGFTVKVEHLAGIYSPINKLAKLTYLYECAIVSGEAHTSSETQQVRFFPLHTLPKLIPPPYPEWISDARRGGETVRKQLTGVTYRALCLYFFSHPLLVIRFLLARIGVPVNS